MAQVWRGIVRGIKMSAAFVLVAVVLSAMAVPMLAKNDGGGGKSETTVLYLSGTPREMGLQYGAMAKDAIVSNVAQFWDWVSVNGLSQQALIADALADEAYLTSEVIDELKGMSKTSGVSYNDLLTFNKYGNDDYEQKACTCFAAAGSGTTDGVPITSKNRDQNNMQVLMLVEPDSGYKFIGMMSAGAVGISQGINEMGLSIGHTWMPVPEYYDPGYAPFIVNQMVMEQCADVNEAIALIGEVPKAEGATFILSDASIAAFVETVPSVINTPDTLYQIITDGAYVHTNHYVMEPFHSWVLDGSFRYFWTPSVARYDRGLELLAENPVLDVQTVMSFTRDLENFGNPNTNAVKDAHPEIPDDCWWDGWPGFSISNARTVSASVFRSDPTNVEELSVMWMAINGPVWAPYVALHNAILNELDVASVLLQDYVKGLAWSAASQLRSSGLYEWGDLVPVYEQWESEQLVDVIAIEDEARALISSGEMDAACLLLTVTDGGIAQAAVELMQSLLESPLSGELVAVPQ